jgi:uncharacterized membrane protein (TIGR02234 family)
MRRHAAFAAALLLDLLGAGVALLVSTRAWQTVTTPQPAPRHDDLLDLSGRTVDAAPTALALVALAGVVAVLATRGLVRRIVGGVLLIAGAGLVWRAIASASAVSTRRARTLVSEHHKTVDVSGVVPRVATHGAWPVLTLVCGLLVIAAGGLIAWRGHRWQAMSARYEARPAATANGTRAAATMWTALDRGEDPTDSGR